MSNTRTVKVTEPSKVSVEPGLHLIRDDEWQKTRLALLEHRQLTAQLKQALAMNRGLTIVMRAACRTFGEHGVLHVPKAVLDAIPMTDYTVDSCVLRATGSLHGRVMLTIALRC
jgi:hypothetical protein